MNPTPEESRHIREAAAAADEIDDLHRKLAEARERRDHSIALAHSEDGLRAPVIARALGERDGLSTPNVRHILRIARIRGQ